MQGLCIKRVDGPSMMVHTIIPATQEVETRGLWLRGQSGQKLLRPYLKKQCTPIVLATWEAYVGGLQFKASLDS
jgi:hypothetical protein